MYHCGSSLSVFLFKTRYGLNLRAIGENPGTADAAGINVTKYKYLSTCIGAGLAGLGGLYFVMEYSGGTWTDNGFGDRGWLAVALVIFALWKPLNAIWGAFLFGALYILYLYIPGLGRSMQEVFKALPYVVTIIVLVFTSFRKKKEHHLRQVWDFRTSGKNAKKVLQIHLYGSIIKHIKGNSSGQGDCDLHDAESGIPYRRYSPRPAMSG